MLIDVLMLWIEAARIITVATKPKIIAIHIEKSKIDHFLFGIFAL